MKFNCDKDQVQIVDSGTDVVRVIRNITESGFQEDAFYIFDVQDLIQKYNNWKEKLPGVVPYYAVKCNDHVSVLKTLSLLGVGFDCASKEEIKKILSIGVDATRIIFANPAKPASHMRYAVDQGIELLTVDSENELYKIKKLHPTAKMLIRIRSDASVSQCPLGVKFGCNSVTEAPALMQLARTLGLDVIGVCFHVGSGCGEPMAYRRAIARAHALFQLGDELGFNMHLLDIGGGFPGEKDSSIDTIADVVNMALEDYFPPSSNVNVIAEPGRYFVASAFTLATLVYSKRMVRDPDTGEAVNMFYINDGIYGSFNSLMYDHAVVEPIPLVNNRSYEMVPCSIWGPTCDSLDLIVERAEFPNLNVGEWIMFENMGAYTFSAASSFNGFPVPKVYTILNDSVKLPLKDALSALEDEFDFEDVSQSKLNDYPLSSSWKDNQQLHGALPEIYCLEEKCPAIPI
ncbi:hypothetical protein V9T40_004939 [Parthenolecanium corni]|uniref:ornithine decarboxylase n=1 Tax=Parthenolecanium corni TaxID=536013 RepID=A0AAN9TES9_9HEMI